MECGMTDQDWFAMKKTPLKRMSKNKARETAKYWPLRKKFLEMHPFCEFNGSGVFTVGCINHATQIHHEKGQHWKIMNDTRYWLAVCAAHHAWIENNKKEARKRGLILYP